MSWNDAAYFRNRAESERALAESAADPVVASIHRELADRYDRLLTEGERPTLRLVAGAEAAAS